MELFINICTYQSNNRLAIDCGTEEEPYADITINLPNTFIDSINIGFIDSVTKDCGLEKALLDEGIIKEIICNQPYNYGNYDCVSFDMKKLKEYDPEGFELYMDSIGFEPHYFPKI